MTSKAELRNLSALALASRKPTRVEESASIGITSAQWKRFIRLEKPKSRAQRESVRNIGRRMLWDKSQLPDPVALAKRARQERKPEPVPVFREAIVVPTLPVVHPIQAEKIVHPECKSVQDHLQRFYGDL